MHHRTLTLQGPLSCAALLVACDASRAPIGAETQIAPTAGELVRLSIKPHRVDPSRERWRVSHTFGGWVLDYTYEGEGLSIDWHASFARSEQSGWVATDVFGQGLRPGENVERLVIDPVPWGEEGSCTVIEVDELAIGYECRGRSGRRGYAVKIYGVSPHGPGAPHFALAGPLRALDLWDPRDVEAGP